MGLPGRLGQLCACVEGRSNARGEVQQEEVNGCRERFVRYCISYRCFLEGCCSETCKDNTNLK